MCVRTALIPVVIVFFLSACGGGGSGSTDPEPDPADNEAPTADAQSTETSEDIDVSITLVGNDSDGSIAGYDITDDPDNGTLSGTAPDLTYTPNEDYNGTDSFQFTVTDDDGAESSPATVDITIHEINDAPSADPPSVTTDEDTATSITLAGSDVDGEVIDFVIVVHPSNGRLSGDLPDLEYTPHADFSGVDRLDFKVEDDDGAFSEPARVQINVTEINDAPMLDDQWFRVRRNRTTHIDIHVTDAEDESITLEIVQEPNHGEASIEESTTLVFNAENGYLGEDQLTLTATDGSGETSEEATITITMLRRSSTRERELMTDLFHALNGPQTWVNNENWDTDAHIREWYGTTVHRGAFVDGLDLRSNGLSGEMPAELAALGYPREFQLSGNDFDGAFLPHLTAVTVLEFLDLSDSGLTGELPRVWESNKESLRVLNLGGNSFEGTVPKGLGSLSNLQVLRLGGNQFSDWVNPDDLPSGLIALDLSENQFAGRLADGFGSFGSLEELHLDNSGFTGRLPMSLMDLTGLNVFRYEGSGAGLCASAGADFQDWLDSIGDVDRHTCDDPPTIAIERVLEMRNVTVGITNRSTELEISNEGDAALDLTISTSHSWLTVSQSSVSIDAFETSSLTVTVDCGDADRRIGTVTISSNDPDRPTRVVEVDVRCLERDLDIEFTSVPSDAGGGPAELNFTGSFSWQMTSSTDDEGPEPYTTTFSATASALLVMTGESEFSGVAAPDETQTHNFSGTCSGETSATATATVTIGTISGTQNFAVVCDPELARVEKLDWYQVPYVATETISYTDTEVENGVKTVERDIPVMAERRAVVRVTFAHGYVVPVDLVAAQWEDATDNSTVDLEEATEGSTIPNEESPFPWSTVYYFHLDADQVTSEESPVLLLRSGGMQDEFRSEISDLAFADVVPFRPVLLPFVVEQGDDPDPEPDWDDDELLYDTRDWLPIGVDDPRRWDTVWVDPGDLPGGFGDNFWVLDETAAYWNDEGEADEFFHGLLFYSLNGHYCGGGVAYLGAQIGMSCVYIVNNVYAWTDILAHEFGHNWDLSHTPCGGPAGVDPNYPYAGATIGPNLQWSYRDDKFVKEDEGYYSFMSYCDPGFTSDYDYRRAAEYFVDQSEIWGDTSQQSPPAAHNHDQPRSIALIARVNIETGEWSILQSKYSRRAPRPSEGGTHTLVIMDHNGHEAHREAITLRERIFTDGNGDQNGEYVDRFRTWAARVPIPAAGMESMKVLDESDNEILSIGTTIEK